MADNDPRNESPEAGLLSKKDFLDAADKLFPKKVPAREYPDHSKYQSDEANKYSSCEETDTSTESILQPGGVEREIGKEAES